MNREDVEKLGLGKPESVNIGRVAQAFRDFGRYHQNEGAPSLRSLQGWAGRSLAAGAFEFPRAYAVND
jgi:hypothetical protein